MFEDKKLDFLRNKEFIGEYLFGRGLSEAIEEHPRYQYILGKIANILINRNVKPFSPNSRQMLDKMIDIDDKGNIIFAEGEGKNNTHVSCKFYIDKIDGKLRKLRVEQNQEREEEFVTVGTYDQYGIEEVLATEQKTQSGMFFTKAVRLKDRIDILKIERFEQGDDYLNKLDDLYRIRSDYSALEDISPDREDIDPYDIKHFSIFGMPELYKDIDFEEKQIPSLSDSEKKEILKKYQELNEFFGRSKMFEKAIEQAFLLDYQDLNK